MITSSQMAEGLAQLFPAATPVVDYQVLMLPDGSGEIAGWKLDAPLPTEQQIVAAAVAYQPTKALIECRQARAKALGPTMGDQFDAIYHAMKDGLIPVVPAFVAIIDPVKEANPKPLFN